MCAPNDTGSDRIRAPRQQRSGLALNHRNPDVIVDIVVCFFCCVSFCWFIIFTRTWLRYVRVFAIAIPSVVCRLSVTLVHPTQEVEAFGNISSPLCTLATLWPSCKISRRSSQGNPSIAGVKHRKGSKIERFWTCRRLYLINGTR